MVSQFLRCAARLTVSVGLSANAALACGEPDQLSLAQAFLGASYENASHVVGAVWSAQQDGVLPMPNREQFSAGPARIEEMIDEAHVAAVEAQGLLGLNLAAFAKDEWKISLVLIETMHWGRFELDPSKPIADNGFDCNAASSKEDDLVVITEAVVLLAVVDGRLTISQAIELELMRLYGSDDRKIAFQDQFSTLGAVPLQDVSGVEGFLARITSLKDLAQSNAPMIGQ